LKISEQEKDVYSIFRHSSQNQKCFSKEKNLGTRSLEDKFGLQLLDSDYRKDDLLFKKIHSNFEENELFGSNVKTLENVEKHHNSPKEEKTKVFGNK